MVRQRDSDEASLPAPRAPSIPTRSLPPPLPPEARSPSVDPLGAQSPVPLGAALLASLRPASSGALPFSLSPPGAPVRFPSERSLEASLSPPRDESSSPPGRRPVRSLPPPLPKLDPLPFDLDPARIPSPVPLAELKRSAPQAVAAVPPASLPAALLSSTPLPQASWLSWRMAVVAGLVGMGGAFAGYLLRSPEPGVYEVSVPANRVATADVASPGASIALAPGFPSAPEVPAMAAAPAPTVAPAPAEPPPLVAVAANVAQDTSPSACIASHFPSGTFTTAPNFDQVCDGRDAWKMAEQFGKDMKSFASPLGLHMWESLGWYELASVAMFRSQCCEAKRALKPATPSGKCGEFDETLRALAEKPDRETRRAHHAVLSCLVVKGIAAPARFRRVKLDDAAEAFVHLRP